MLSGYSGLAIPYMENFKVEMDLNSENKIFNKLHQYISESTLLSSYINMGCILQMKSQMVCI